MPKPLTVLVTGFGPFPGAPVNPTETLTARLLRLRRPALAELRLVGHVFRTSYAAVDAELPMLIAEHRPDVVLMFGLATRTKFLRVETCARNVRSSLLADAAGQLPALRILAAGGPARLSGRAPFISLLAALRRTRLPVRLSRDPGRYLCNYAYWRAAEIPPPLRPLLVVFVHVPKLLRGRRPQARAKTRGFTPADLERAGEAVLCTLVAAARKR
ncbi:MAG TPA: pyroglutamyl-peptidase I [Xanthobacteraceae bacterium]|nr:pyroglutamyl-peptidase I [Xanthobacteraceae bacterium]